MEPDRYTRAFLTIEPHLESSYLKPSYEKYLETYKASKLEASTYKLEVAFESNDSMASE